jgi:hypothetical protein
LYACHRRSFPDGLLRRRGLTTRATRRPPPAILRISGTQKTRSTALCAAYGNNRRPDSLPGRSARILRETRRAPDASSHPLSHCQRLSREHPDRQLRLRFPPRDFRRSRPERHPDHRRRRTTANIVRRGGPLRTSSRTMALRSWPSMPPSPTSLSRSRFPSWDWPSGTLNTAAARFRSQPPGSCIRP